MFEAGQSLPLLVYGEMVSGFNKKGYPAGDRSFHNWSGCSPALFASNYLALYKTIRKLKNTQNKEIDYSSGET